MIFRCGWNVIPCSDKVIYLLVGGFKHLLFSIIYGIILPIDFHMFQRGRYTTKQLMSGCQYHLAMSIMWIRSSRSFRKNPVASHMVVQTGTPPSEQQLFHRLCFLTIESKPHVHHSINCSYNPYKLVFQLKGNRMCPIP